MNRTRAKQLAKMNLAEVIPSFILIPDNGENGVFAGEFLTQQDVDVDEHGEVDEDVMVDNGEDVEEDEVADVADVEKQALMDDKAEDDSEPENEIQT